MLSVKSSEILKNIEIKDVELVKKVNSELEILEKENKLDDFYNIWKKYNGKVGHINKINSWTAYCLGMTDAKPDGDFLPERRVFARAGFPDIDSDFDYFYRDEIYNYIIEKYGRDNVGNIGTYSLLKLKSAVRRIGKALDIASAFHKGPKDYKTLNEAKVSEIIDSLPPQRGAFIKINDEEGKEQTIKTIADAYKYCPDFRRYIDKFPGIKEHSKNIEGLISNSGIHASGFCLSNEPLSRIAPLKVSKKGLATQFAYEDLEAIGLIKFDILAISTLTVIQKTVDMIYQNYGIKIDVKNLKPNNEETFKLYRSGNLTGIFQAEGKGMQETFQEVETSNFNDIMATIALYRPGPMISIPEYCARKKGLKNIDYFHPSIEKYVKPYLEETYGVLTYQESVMQICNALAGFSVTDGYVMIKGIGKKKKDLIDKFRKQFVEGCCKNSVPQNIAEQYWDKFIVPFSSYGFNKAHCLCGSTIVKNNLDKKFYTLQEVFDNKGKKDFILDSFMGNPYDGNIIGDKLVDIFETGIKIVFRVELENGIVIKSTKDHKFYCYDDLAYHTIEAIYNKNMSILFFRQENMDICKIKSIKYIGEEKTYNLTMASEQHNYTIYGEENTGNFIVSKNSCCYAYTSYITAYLKANYTDEFMCCYLNVENRKKQQNSHKKVLLLEKDLANFNIELLPRDINTCNVDYEIAKKKNVNAGILKTQIRPAIICKGIGVEVAEDIVKHRPYTDLRSMAHQTTQGLFTKEDLGSLIDIGFLNNELKEINKGKNRKDKISLEKFKELVTNKFDNLRKDKKKSAEKGIGQEGLFD